MTKENKTVLQIEGFDNKGNIVKETVTLQGKEPVETKYITFPPKAIKQITGEEG